MELSLDQIHKYLNCPTEYDFRYKKNIPVEETENVKYKKAIHKTISYLYFSMMGGWMPSAKQMKDKWATIWEEEKQGELDLTDAILKERSPRNKRETDKRIIQGYEMIHNFYHYNKDNLGVPIAVDHEFRVPIGGVTVTGKFELIRESLDKSSPNRFIEIVDFKTGNEATDMFLVNNDLNLTVMSYAFRNLFQAKEDRLTYNYMKTGKEIYTSREEKHYDRMKAIIEGVAEGIANERFYPRQSFMCKSCPFKDACDIARF
jgi:CRISPR/Cas system-associated exonuclease Cas4 (RecB family)